jgi:hypothetical protein
MGSMWVDPAEDPKVYQVVQGGLPIPVFDRGMKTGAERFPRERWGADFRAMLWLAEFAADKDWPAKAADGIPSPPHRDSLVMDEGIKELIHLQKTERESAMPEILAQHDNFQMYFCAQLGIYPRVSPRSYLLLKIAARIAEMAMVRLKWDFASESVRPSHIYPLLMPVVAVPPHASYPSGHATVSHLLALVAQDIVPKFGDAPTLLALRIRRNREVGGLHFWWDGVAGEKAAGNVFRMMKSMSGYTAAVEAARKEWP